jgi:hypothetical protein
MADIELDKSSRTLKQFLTDWRFYLLCLTVILLPPIVAAFVWSPVGTASIYQIAYASTMFSGLLVLILLFADLCAVICLLTPGISKSSFHFLLLSLMLLISLTIGYFLSDSIRRNGIVTMTKNSKILIEAIKSFEKTKGHPPEKLETITPDFLVKIPGTGIGIFPNYEYSLHAPENADTWELRVPCPEGVLNWNLLFYWPSENYPSTIYGGYTERIGSWAYVNE